ncbi:hypothetical protein JHK86_006800 [Glycine max]|nr:hypothetical protein JHK86_006800 [Glycine max]
METKKGEKGFEKADMVLEDKGEKSIAQEEPTDRRFIVGGLNERLDGDVFYEEIEGATIGDSEANKRIKMHKFRRIFQGLAAKSITMPVNSVEEVPTFPRSPLGGSIGPTSTLGETIEVF